MRQLKLDEIDVIPSRHMTLGRALVQGLTEINVCTILKNEYFNPQSRTLDQIPAFVMY